MGKDAIIKLLNADRADELGAIMQYMGHHYEAEGMKSPEIIELFKEISIDEMKHAAKLAQRIVYLGGVPTQKPTPFKRGGSLEQMIKDDLAAEKAAVKQYKEHIAACAADPATRLMLEEILADEEEHVNKWETTLGIRK